jgi:hypothetical protein
VRIGRFAVGEGGADLLREIDRQSSLAVVRDESAGRTDMHGATSGAPGLWSRSRFLPIRASIPKPPPIRRRCGTSSTGRREAAGRTRAAPAAASCQNSGRRGPGSADVKRLKQEDGPNLVTQGSIELVHALLANDLVDAMSIFTVPVVPGGGKKLFNGSAPHSFQLTSSRVSPNGLIVGHYEREGQIKIGDTTLDSPSEREIARPERMKREG